MAAGADTRSVFSTVPLTHKGVEVPVGTDLRDLGLEDHQLDALVELGEASRDGAPKRSRRAAAE